MNRFRYILFSLAALGLLNGCAFFNTYFNARKAYNNGMQSLRKAQSARAQNINPAETADTPFLLEPSSVPEDAKQFFATAIEKANKVIVLHPESRWVGPAILLLGKAYYNRGTVNDYYDAKNRLEVYFLKYPESPDLPEAWLWYARTLHKLNFRNATREYLNRVVEADAGSFLQTEALLLLGVLDEYDNDWTAAEEHYRTALHSARQEHQKKFSLYKLAALSLRQHRYGAAQDYYRSLLRRELDVAEQFDVTLRLARTLGQMGQYDQAVDLLDDILGTLRFKPYYVAAEYEIAEILRIQGRYREADKQYRHVINTYKNASYSGLAFFRIGAMLDSVPPDNADGFKPDRELSAKYYQLVSAKYPQSVFANEARRRLTAKLRDSYFRESLRLEQALYDSIQFIYDCFDSLTAVRSVKTTDRTDHNQDSTILQDSLLMTGHDRLPVWLDSVDVDTLSWLKNLENLDSLELSVTEKEDHTEKDLQNHKAPYAAQGSGDLNKTTDTTQQGRKASVDTTDLAAREIMDVRIENSELAQKIKMITTEKQFLETVWARDSLLSLQSRVRSRLAQTYLEMAQYFFYDLKMNDSALNYFQLVADRYPDSDYEETALYNIAAVYETMSAPAFLPAIRRAYEKYPQGRLAAIYERLFGGRKTASDSADALLQAAERALFCENDYARAITTYAALALSDSLSYKSRALYMMGLISEQKLDNREQAFRWYCTLQWADSASEWAARVKPKISNFIRERGMHRDSLAYWVDTQFVKVDYSKIIIKKDTAEILPHDSSSIQTTLPDSGAVTRDTMIQSDGKASDLKKENGAAVIDSAGKKEEEKFNEDMEKE